MPQPGAPAHTLGMGSPQVTAVGSVSGQRGAQTQRPALQVRPAPQRVPVPGQVAPGQLLVSVAPQSTVLGSGHEGVQTQRPP